MDRLACSTLRIARLVLEARTALSISTGNPDGVFDTALVRDANGLPAIPGSSLAGVLRHLYRSEHGDTAADGLFGHQHGRSGEASRLTLSWGVMLDSKGEPADGLLLGEAAKRLDADPLYRVVLSQADSPVYRDRVRLTHRGAAAHQGKFDRSIVPAGHRFAIELRYWSPAEEGDEIWNRLLGLFGHPGFRLGGNTRAGLGKMAVVRLHQGVFDLRDPAEAARLGTLGTGLGNLQGLTPAELPAIEAKGWRLGRLTLKARGLWRIGQGRTSIDEKTKKPADLLPKTEERIDWEAEQARRALRLLLLPASSLKGALAHRMAFHARRFAGHWNGPDLVDDRPGAVNLLLGHIKEDGAGRVGALVIDDAWLKADAVQVVHLMHNVIDRFTGGVRDRMLFEEESLLGGALEVELAVDTMALRGEDEALAKKAFAAALDDLCNGRLALGSKTTTGNGYFEGRLDGPLAEWLAEAADEQQVEVA